MVWNPPQNADLFSGNIAKSSDVKAIRDLPASMAARDSGAPWLNGVGEIDVITASGSWIVPTGVTRVRVIMIGGGGAGGAGQDTNGATSSPGIGGGGGAGSLAVHSGLATVPAETLTVTIGAGGAGGSGAGGAGGTTTVSTVVGAWVSVSANGGGGGAAGVDAYGAGGAGATAAVAGDIPGADGWMGMTSFWTGRGAPSFFGSGARPSSVNASLTGEEGHDAELPGSGGSGGIGSNNLSTQTKNGGDGAPGIVIIEY